MQAEKQVDEKLLTPGDIAERLQISKAMAYLILKRGEIPSIRIGSLVRVRRADLEKYIRDNTGLDASNI